ncbi:MAG: efflux RND transporter periplasmic adaptor subunit [Chlorobi bacterium]|nr:efflux RND transporter periplasmic adaptor subunit [Chlorobiota bacterium]
MQTLQKVLPKYTIALSLVFVVTVIYLITRGNTVEVDAVEVTHAELVQAVYATGFVEADAVANLSAEFSGTVKSVGALEGERVVAGQTIIAFDAVQPDLAVREARSAYAEQLAMSGERKLKYTRIRNLFGEGAVSRQDLDDALKNMRQADELLEQKRLQLKIREDDLKKLAVTAPFTGILAFQGVKTGDYVTANTLVARVIDTTDYVVSVEVDELDVPRIRSGQKAAIVLDALPDKRLDAVVSRIVPQTDTVTKTSKVYLRFYAPVKGIQAGMTATANIIYNVKPNSLLVRKSSVFEEDHVSYVWKIENGKLRKQSLKTGAGDLAYVEVIDGLRKGDKVVPVPEERFREGMDARIAVKNNKP